MPWTREEMCSIAAMELKDGYYCNLGIGMPTKVANYIIDKTFGIKSKYFWDKE